MPVDSESEKFFLLGLDEARSFGRAGEDTLTGQLLSLRDALALKYQFAGDLRFIQHGQHRKKCDLREQCIFLRQTNEPNPGIPLITARWDFTVEEPEASVRAIIFYPGPEVRSWGFRWELPGMNTGARHNYSHVQPIRQLVIGNDLAPSPAAPSENAPTFMVSRRTDRPDILFAHALISIYGEDPDLLSLLHQLPNGSKVIRELGGGSPG